MLGISVHQMGGFDHEAARKALGIPEEYALGAVIALDYQGEPAAIANEQLWARLYADTIQIARRYNPDEAILKMSALPSYGPRAESE